MKKILLWDPRFPEAAPARLDVDDAVASACVRAGVAAAADPLDAGSLAAGGAISSADPVEVVLESGVSRRMRRVMLPTAVASIAIAAGIAASTGKTVVGGGGTPTPTPSNDPLEQLSVGTVGTGDYAGYTLAYVQPFNGTLADNLVRPGNPNGFMTNNFSERDRRRTSITSVGTLVDIYNSGVGDANDGVGLASTSDVLTMGDGAVSIKSRLATVPERAFLGDRSNASGPAYTDRRMLWAHPNMPADHAAKGPRIMEVRWSFNNAGLSHTADANTGFAMWMLDVRGGSEAGSDPGAHFNNEVDLIETHIGGGQFNNRTGAGFQRTISGSQMNPRLDGVPMITRLVISHSAMTITHFADDGVTVRGTGSVVSNQNQLDAMFYFMFGIINTTTNVGNSAAFNEATMAGKEPLAKVHSLRIWTANGQETLAPAVASPAPLSIDFGGTGTLTLPSQATLWGDAVDNEYFHWNNGHGPEGPGRSAEFTSIMETRDALPVGVTYDAPTRTFTFSSSFSAAPGAMYLYVYPSKAASGVSRPYKVAIYVKPRLKILTLAGPAVGGTPGQAAGGAYSYTIPKAKFSNGNLITGTGLGLTLISGPGWLSFNPATRTLSGNCPAGFTSANLTFRMTNGVGQTTDETVALIAGATGFHPSDITSYIYGWDTTDAASAPDDGAGKVQFLNDTVLGSGRRLAQPTGSARPVIDTTVGNRVLRFSKANQVSIRDNTTGAQGQAPMRTLQDGPANNKTSYLAFVGKADSAAEMARFVYWSSTTANVGMRQATTPSRGFSVGVGTGGIAGDALPDTNLHVFECVRSGANLELLVDGVSVGTATVANTTAFTASSMMLGGYYNGSTVTPDLNGVIGSGVLCSAIPTSQERSSLRNWLALRHGLQLPA